MLFEDRAEKLKRRLPAEVEPNTSLALTMSWVLAGPTITSLRDQITDALTEELADTREAIAEGTEHAPTLEIPVRDGTTYPAIRRVIDEIAMTHDVQWTPRERQRVVRLCLRSFGPSDTSRKACPYDVVESLLRALSESQRATLADVELAASTLPTMRFRPDLTPTATKLYAALLRVDEPLGRSELIDRAGISASSYDRRIRDIRGLARVTGVHVDGHRRWATEETPVPVVTHTPCVRDCVRDGQTAAPLLWHRYSTIHGSSSVGVVRRWGLSQQNQRDTLCVRYTERRLIENRTANPHPGVPRGEPITHPSTARAISGGGRDMHQATLPTRPHANRTS